MKSPPGQEAWSPGSMCPTIISLKGALIGAAQAGRCGERALSGRKLVAMWEPSQDEWDSVCAGSLSPIQCSKANVTFQSCLSPGWRSVPRVRPEH